MRLTQCQDEVSRSLCRISRSLCRISRSLCRISRSLCKLSRSLCRISRSLCKFARSLCRSHEACARCREAYARSHEAYVRSQEVDILTGEVYRVRRREGVEANEVSAGSREAMVRLCEADGGAPQFLLIDTMSTQRLTKSMMGATSRYRELQCECCSTRDACRIAGKDLIFSRNQS